MFCAKKVTKLPDLTVVNTQYFQRDIAMSFFTNCVMIDQFVLLLNNIKSLKSRENWRYLRCLTAVMDTINNQRKIFFKDLFLALS
jgi:hypothetical protein